MSPLACRILVEEIMPILTARIPRLRLVGCDDHEEVTADAVAGAAAMLDSAERAGKPLLGRSVAHYCVQRAKVGRRSTSAARTDAMSPAASLDGNAFVFPLDVPVTSDVDGGCELSLADMLAASGDDACTLAGRNIDWNNFMVIRDSCDNDILVKTAEGGTGSELAQSWCVSPARITQRKHKIASALTSAWGDNVLAEVQREPLWASSMRSYRSTSASQLMSRQV